ncbi:MAG: hypothetical protein HC851_17660 [Acaryochloris sp. RU_4_1]|nr:hypothetical protein [Acaryochloris sp. RU_4_1]
MNSGKTDSLDRVIYDRNPPTSPIAPTLFPPKSPQTQTLTFPPSILIQR